MTKKFPSTYRTEGEAIRRKDLDRAHAEEIAQPDIDFCSKCREHTEFEMDEDGDLVSVCCGTVPMTVD